MCYCHMLLTHIQSSNREQGPLSLANSTQVQHRSQPFQENLLHINQTKTRLLSTPTLSRSRRMERIQMKTSLISRMSWWSQRTRPSFQTMITHLKRENSSLLNSRTLRFDNRPRLTQRPPRLENQHLNKRSSQFRNTTSLNNHQEQMPLRTKESSWTRTKPSRFKISTKSSCSNSSSNRNRLLLINLSSPTMIPIWAMKWLESHLNTIIIRLLQRFLHMETIRSNPWVKTTS